MEQLMVSISVFVLLFSSIYIVLIGRTYRRPSYLMAQYRLVGVGLTTCCIGLSIAVILTAWMNEAREPRLTIFYLVLGSAIGLIVGAVGIYTPTTPFRKLVQKLHANN